jgi:hypothetical protein
MKGCGQSNGHASVNRVPSISDSRRGGKVKRERWIYAPGCEGCPSIAVRNVRMCTMGYAAPLVKT